MMIFDQVEDGILGRIKAASDADVLGYRFRTLTTYGGEFDPGQSPESLEDELRQLVRQFPAAWAVYAGATFTERGEGLYDVSHNFAVVVAARSLRNEAKSRRGDGSAVGSYQLVKDVVGLCSGHNLGLEIDPLLPLNIRTLWNRKVRGEMLSVFAISFRTAESLEADHTDELDDFKEFHVDWDVPVFGDFDSVPLDPADADATDDVQVPGPQA